MRKFASLLVVALIFAACAAGFAQSNQTYPTREFYASDFGQWSLQGQTPNVYQWSPGSLCLTAANGTASQFQPFATNAPVLIADVVASSSEVVTPSAVSNTASFCTITVAPSNQHFSFQVRSGTGGLQEGLNQTKDRGAYPALMKLDRNFWALANAVPGTSGNTIVGAAKGDATVMLEDITTAPEQMYVWTGSAYSATAAFWQNTAPTIAAGAAAGTSPTVANIATSTALVGQANVTSGTATTTGTLFTETWPTNAGTVGSFQYAPTCTVTSIGVNSFTAFTIATTFTASHAVLTVTATSAPAVSTPYQFSINCK